MKRFDDDRYYRCNDPALGLIATKGTLGLWRHEGRGPRYSKVGNRVLYFGADLNAWLDQHTVTPPNNPPAMRPNGRAKPEGQPAEPRPAA